MNKLLNTPQPQSAQTYQEKYEKQITLCLNKPEKLRKILKQLNDEVSMYLEKRKLKQLPKQQLQPNKVILEKESNNNNDIIKRLKFEFNKQRKRLTVLEQKTYRLDLENKVLLCEENIRKLNSSIDLQKKINQRQSKEIILLDEQNGVNQLQQEIWSIDKAIQEYQEKNSMLKQSIVQVSKQSQQFSDYSIKLKDKIHNKQEKCSEILDQDQQNLEDLYYKLQAQYQNQERHRKILDDKYTADVKLLKSDIIHKQKQLQELENVLTKIHVDIIQVTEISQRLKEQLRKRSSQMKQRIKRSQFLNQQSFQLYESDNQESKNQQQQLSKSFTSPYQIDQLNMEEQNTDQEQLGYQERRCSVILEELQVKTIEKENEQDKTITEQNIEKIDLNQDINNDENNNKQNE